MLTILSISVRENRMSDVDLKQLEDWHMLLKPKWRTSLIVVKYYIICCLLNIKETWKNYPLYNKLYPYKTV